MPKRLWMIAVLFMGVGLIIPTPFVQAEPSTQQGFVVPPLWQIVELTNDTRLANGLPPLAYNSDLANAAQFHSQSMASSGFFAHEDPINGTTPSVRVSQAGYDYASTGENIYAGSPSPSDAYTAWLNSPGHYANIVDNSFREIGVGYAQNRADSLGYYYYWTQNFGSRFDHFPLVIENEAYFTSQPSVSVYVYGQEVAATEMRFAIDGNPYGDWQPFQTVAQVTLPTVDGVHTITVEIRVPDGTVYTDSDTILLTASSVGLAPTPIPTVIATQAVLVPPATAQAATSTAQEPTPQPTIAIGTPVDLYPEIPASGRAVATSLVDKPSGLEAYQCWPWHIIIPLLWLVIIIALSLIYWGRRGYLWFWAPKCSWRCRLARFTFLLYLAFLGYLVGTQTGGLCGVQGTLIWRADAGRSADFVSISDSDPEQVYAIDGFDTDSDCVGCHTYNDNQRLMIYITGGLGGQVHLFDRETETTTPLINETDGTPLRSSYAALSPDGRTIALALNDADIYIYDIATQTLEALVNDPIYIETMPTWSHNGDFIIYARSEQPAQPGPVLRAPTDLWRITLASGANEPMTNASEAGVFEYYPAFSPRGTWLAFTRHSGETSYADPDAEVWILNQITNQNPQPVAGNGASWPIWSEDGEWLAYRSVEQDTASDAYMVQVDDTGIVSSPFALDGAASEGIFEHLPAAWRIAPPLSIMDIVWAMLPWLLPLLPWLWLALYGCFPLVTEVIAEAWTWPVVVRQPLPPITPKPAQKLPVWHAGPALVIGFGVAGRWTLTHLKKTLYDAGLGTLPNHIPLLSIAAGDHARLSEQETQSGYAFGGIELTAENIFEWKQNLHILVQQAHHDPALEGWMNPDFLNAIGQAGQDPQVGLNNQRVLGRLAIIDNLRRSDVPEEQLWERLKVLGQRAVEQKRLLVIMVADTSDDVGSGGIFDVAYLCRLLGKELGLSEVQIVAHFLTDQSQTQADAFHAQVNAIAFARELTRFQLASIYPFPMRYGTEKFDGVSNTQLFDEVYYYDGRSYPVRNALPQYGIYPLIADSIAIRLDRGADQLTNRLSDIRGNTQEQELYRSQLVVGTMGIRQQRIPVADLLEIITLGYARQALQVLLAAGSQPPWQLNAAHVVDFYLFQDETPHHLVESFFAGDLGTPQNMSPEMWRVFQTLANRTDIDLDKSIRQVNKKTDNIEALKDWLNNALLLLLNGERKNDEVEVNYLTKRGAKIGLAYEFLVGLVGEKGTAGYISHLQGRIKNTQENNVAFINEQLSLFATYASELLQQVSTLANHLGFGRGSTLFRHLIQQGAKIKQNQQDLSNLVVREYLWNDPIDQQPYETKWYKPLEQQLPVLMSRLHWQLNNGKLHLVLHKPKGEEPVVFDTTTPERFGDAMIDVAYEVAAPIWRQAGIPLENENRDSLLKNMQQESHPGLDLDPQSQDTIIPSLIFAGQVAAEHHEPISLYLSNQLKNPDNFALIKPTDAFSLTMLQLLQGVVWPNTGQYATALTQYYKEVGLGELPFDPRRSIPTAIFAAEQTALSFERRLRPELRVKPRLLHPITVTMLAEPYKVRAYLLAVAAGSVLTVSEERKSVDCPLINALFRIASLNLGRLAAGLIAFLQHVSSEQAAILNDHFRDQEDNYLDAWEKWYEQDHQLWTAGHAGEVRHQVTTDLIDIGRMLINEIL